MTLPNTSAGTPESGTYLAAFINSLQDMKTTANTTTNAPTGGNGPIAAFARFVVFGGGTGIASSGALVALSGSLPIAVANALVTVVSTLLATELHSRFTFGGGRADLRAHAQSASSALAAYLFTTTAMLLLAALLPGAGTLLTQGVYLAASALAGIGRFMVLRLFVFRASGTSTRRTQLLSRTRMATAA